MILFPFLGLALFVGRPALQLHPSAGILALLTGPPQQEVRQVLDFSIFLGR